MKVSLARRRLTEERKEAEEDATVSRVFQIRSNGSNAEGRGRRGAVSADPRTNGLDLIPTLMPRQATAIHFAPACRIDSSLSLSLSLSCPVVFSLS